MVARLDCLLGNRRLMNKYSTTQSSREPKSWTKGRLLAGFIVLCITAPVLAQSTNRLSVEDLRRVRLPDVVLESARSVTPDRQKNPGAAAHVEVKGVIGGSIRFELLLPDAW